MRQSNSISESCWNSISLGSVPEQEFVMNFLFKGLELEILTWLLDVIDSPQLNINTLFMLLELGILESSIQSIKQSLGIVLRVLLDFGEFAAEFSEKCIFWILVPELELEGFVK